MPDDERSESPADEVELRRMARALAGVLEKLSALAGDEEEDAESLAQVVGAHLAEDPRTLPVLTHAFPDYQLVDVQVAIETWVSEAGGRSMEVVGVRGDQRRFQTFSELLGGRHHGVGVGPVEYVDMPDSPESTRSCVQFGLFLLADGANRTALLLRGSDPHGPMSDAMIEIVDRDPEAGKALMSRLKHLAVERSVLRGQVLALGPGEGHRYGALRFMHRPGMQREDLVLPEATLAHVEGHVLGIASHAERLKAAGQHLKRGILLYGPPGTGKTHTIRYLLSHLTQFTAFVLSGQSLALVGQACGLARVFQPSMVVLEDVDLIAGDRSFGPLGSNPLLFEVLNQIDGLGDDVDVTFVLTTNRVDILERALAERPGRVDAAVEIAAPDEEGRRRLFRLYGAGLGVTQLTDDELSPAVRATEGKTATYLREVVRRAALAAAGRTPDAALAVDAAGLAGAADELLEDRAALTRALLGSAEEPDAEPPFVSPPQIQGASNLGGLVATRVSRMRIGPHGRPSGDSARPFAPDE